MAHIFHFLEPRGDTVAAVYLAFSAAFFYFNRKQNMLSTVLCWIAYSLVPPIAVVLYRLSPFHPLAGFPGPLLSRMTNLRLAYVVSTGKRHLDIAKLHDKYGVIVRTGPNTLSINSQDAVKSIYAGSKAMDKSNAYRPGRLFEGGLFFIRRKNLHDNQRRIWAPAFSQSSLHLASNTILRRSQQLTTHLEKLEDGATDMGSMIRRWSYDVMGDLTFGKSSRIELMSDGDPHGVLASGEKATVLFEILGEIPLIFDLMCYLPRACMQEIHVLRQLASELLAARQVATHIADDDICSHLLCHTANCSVQDLEHDVLFAIQAGSDTTSGVVILLLYHLLANREVYQTLTAELRDNLGSTLEEHKLSALFQLPYLSAVVQEGLRLGTPFPGLPRVVPDTGKIICSKFIPGGTIVGVPAYAQQISPQNFWPNPLEFNPQRWLPGGLGLDSVLNKSAVMCFSSGPFGCLGKNLAIRELYIVIAQLLLTLDIQLDTSFDHKQFKEGIQNMRSTCFQYPLLVVVQPNHL
ncbi:cytochrome P450 [Favolaschia claudopus]|uniref:Cytochrome P450 n=1 Tax=Favolaschia claudopus TaxID=2862362 RepID=A0AAV9ZQN4_9AGAR